MNYAELSKKTSEARTKGYIKGLEWARDHLELMPPDKRLIEIEIDENKP